MELKQMVRYRIDPDSGWITASSLFAGLSIFAIALYFFVLTDISELGAGGLIVQVVIPLIWLVAYVVIAKGLRMNNPLVYGGMGAVYCLMMMIWGFQTPTILGSVFGAIFYLLAAAAMVAVTMGLFPGSYYLAAVLGAVVLMQVFWHDLSTYIISLKFKDYLPLLSRISGVAALSMMCFGLRGRPLRRK